MISISQLNPHNMLTKDILTKLRDIAFVNYNLLIPKVDTYQKIQKQIAHLQVIAEYVDHIYLVLNKDPIGKPRNSQEIFLSEERMSEELFYLQTIEKRLPSSIWRKIDVDGCLKDIEKYNKTGFGCSANISKMQVWPDGKITGCSYADKSNDNQKIALTSKDIIDNIKLAKKDYDFREIPCHLLSDYKNSLGYPKESHLKRMTNILNEIL